jgi:hypothetical protein
MKTETVLGIISLIAVSSFVVFAFRQGMKVKNKPEGVPPERIDAGMP